MRALPSARLLRAVTAERADLERQRAHLAREAADLRAALARIETGWPRSTRAAGAGPARPRARGRAGRGPAPTGEPPTLRGPAIRETAVRRVVEPGRDALHYRDGSTCSCNGHEVAGKDPLAVFLTQFTRSPVVRKGARPGATSSTGRPRPPRRARRPPPRLASAGPARPTSQPHPARTDRRDHRTEKHLDEAARCSADLRSR